MHRVQLDFVPDISAADKEICTKYWSVDVNGTFLSTISKLARDYGMRESELRGIVESSCIPYTDETRCQSCEKPFQFANRRQFANFNPIAAWTCTECEEAAKEAAEYAVYRMLSEKFATALINPVIPAEFDVEDLVALIAILRSGATESLEYIRPYAEYKEEGIGFSREYDLELIERLYQENLLAIRPLTDPRYVLPNDDQGFRYYPEHVEWLVPYELWESGLSHLIGGLEAQLRLATRDPESVPALLTLVTEFSINECLALIERLLREHNLPFR